MALSDYLEQNGHVPCKTCPRCERHLGAGQFWRDKRRHDGLQTYCKSCFMEYRKGDDTRPDYMKRYYQRHREKQLDRARENAYGITGDEFRQMLREQNGQCAICGGTNEDTALCVDHDHETGEIRGLLCTACNMALGGFQDDPGLLKAAIKYLGGDI